MEVRGKPKLLGECVLIAAPNLLHFFWPAQIVVLRCSTWDTAAGAHICKHSVHVHSYWFIEILWKLQSFLILIFYSGSTSGKTATVFQIITNQTKPSVALDFSLWLCSKIMNCKAFVPASLWICKLFKLVWTYCCCPWFPENVINCLKKKKKETSQDKYKHSAEICCGVFPQWSQRKLGFHPSDLFQGKNVPNPYNYILVSAFNKVQNKER